MDKTNEEVQRVKQITRNAQIGDIGVIKKRHSSAIVLLERETDLVMLQCGDYHRADGVMGFEGQPVHVVADPDQPGQWMISPLVKLRLTLDVIYDTKNTVKTDVLVEMLRAMVASAMGDGWITGETEAEVVQHEVDVEIVWDAE